MLYQEMVLPKNIGNLTQKVWNYKGDCNSIIKGITPKRQIYWASMWNCRNKDRILKWQHLWIQSRPNVKHQPTYLWTWKALTRESFAIIKSNGMNKSVFLNQLRQLVNMKSLITLPGKLYTNKLSIWKEPNWKTF